MTAANEERILPDVIQASCLEGDLDFGGKLSTRLAWDTCRNQSPGAGGGSHNSAAAPKKPPTGVETRLRKVWLDLHRFNLNGNWLVQDELITKIYEGLHEEARELYIPDITAIVKKSDLRQKANGLKGTLMTEEGIENIDLTINPCTHHP